MTVDHDPLLSELRAMLDEGKQQVVEAGKFVKSKSASYLDLSGRRLVDSAIAVIVFVVTFGLALLYVRTVGAGLLEDEA